MLSAPAARRAGLRAGFTLAEILVALSVLSILGLAFTRLLLTQSRFSDQQAAYRSARAVSRASVNVLTSELRMVQDSNGIDSASTDGRTIRVIVPYWFGLNCGVQSATRNVVSMLPVDSMVVAQAKFKGWGWRSSTGKYTLVYPAAPLGADAPVASAFSAKCTGTASGQAQVRAVTVAGRTSQVIDIKPPVYSAPVGQPVFFFQRVTYSFKASVAFPGWLGLWRAADGGVDEELVAPFDSTSRFKYWTAGASAAVAAPPALPLIRGVDVIFSGVSTYTPSGKTSPVKSMVVTSMFFKNVRSF